ncbi:MAG: hypothetical protein JW900_02300 [Anaerolineae bacterium]|nr:hypothetical protein [Anaerolineae bacterium]
MNTTRTLQHWLLLVLLLVQFLVSFRPAALAWDGAFYYAYARSILFDGDLELENDLLLSYAVTPPDFAAAHLEQRRTPTGRVDSPFAIGTSLLWLPWFALIYGLANLAGWLPGPLTGYEWPFVWGMAAVTCAYGWLGTLVSYRLARRLVSNWAALAASATLMLTTPLVYYQFREPFYAHAASALTVALFISAWWQVAAKRKYTVPSALLLSLTGGLAALVRPQNIAYLALPVLTALLAAGSALRQREWRTARRCGGYALLVGLGALVVLSPQLAVWQLFYGQPLTIPQGAGFMDWRAPWAGAVLFSPFNGLLPWMPVCLPALVGLALLARRFPHQAILLLMALLLQVYVNGCILQWYGGGGYGPRRFSSTLVILLTGYAAFLDSGKSRWQRLLLLAPSLLLILHQWLILRYGFTEHIGGQVIRSNPSYQWEWQASSGAEFAQRLVGYLPLAVRHPLQTLLLPDAPLRAPPAELIRQLGLLAGVLAALHLLRRGWERLYGRAKADQTSGSRWP